MVYLITQHKGEKGTTNDVTIRARRLKPGEPVGECDRVTYAEDIVETNRILYEWGNEELDKGKEVYIYGPKIPDLVEAVLEVVKATEESEE